jgi:hypothetical protein
MFTDTIRSSEMYLQHEALARAQSCTRLGEAQMEMAQHRFELTVARRLSRKAEKAARQARLALARAV